MSIRPVDFQVSIPRSTDVARNNNAPGRGDEVRHVFSQEMQKQVEIENNQVLSANKSEYNGVDKDGKNNSQQGGKEDKEKKNKKDGEGKQAAVGRISKYDISI